MRLPARLCPVSHLPALGRRLACGNTPYPGITQETLNILSKRYEALMESNSCSLLRKHLDPRTLHVLKQIKTPTYSANILDCVQSGLIHHDSYIGAYAADAESYKTFARLFDKLIEDYHGFRKCAIHPCSDFGDPCSIENIDPQNRFVLSTRMRMLRNIEGFPLAPLMKKRDYKLMEEVVIPVLSRLTGDLKGWYFDEASTFESQRRKWIENHLYGIPDRFMKAAHIGRHFPLGRGFYNTLYNKFSVWMNFEDHMRIVSMQDGGDAGQVYRRLIRAMEQLEDFLPFMRDDRLGFVTTNPKNLGTGFRASVHIRLLKIPKNPSLFQELLDKHNLMIRGTYGEGYPIEKSIYDISNRRTLGVTEIEAVQDLCNGVAEMMYCERVMKVHNCKFLRWYPKNSNSRPEK